METFLYGALTGAAAVVIVWGATHIATIKAELAKVKAELIGEKAKAVAAVETEVKKL